MEASQILKSTVHLAWGILAGVLHPRGHLAGDILGCHTAGGGHYWHPGVEAGDAANTLHAQDSPQQGIAPKAHSAEVRNHGFRDTA